ncbi:MAG: hypothetical protein ACJ763_05775 [Bdellovibrionia bacterium]
MLNRFKPLSSLLSRSPLSQLSVLLLVATVTVLQLGHFSADADEPSRIPLQLQKLKLERQQQELLDQGISSELVNVRGGNFAIWIKPEGTSKENRLASQLKKKLGVSLYISPGTLTSSVAAFEKIEKSIYLFDASALREDYDVLMHEVRHAKFKKQITSADSDMFHGDITRNVVLESSPRLNYFKKGLSLEENFTFPYELRLNAKTAFTKPGKTGDIIRVGSEINEFTIKVLTELFDEVSRDVSNVSLGMMPASVLSGSPQDDIAAYMIRGKNFKLLSFISGAKQGDSQQQMVDALKQSLQRKIDYYTQAREHWNKVKASFDARNASEYSQSVRELLSGAREQLRAPCVAGHLKSSLK